MISNKYFTIILARSGSKEIKNKNIINLRGRPLLYWTIKNSLKSKKIIKTFVSSDSNKILRIAKKFGAETIKRPKKLAGDNSSSEEAWCHALEEINKKYEKPSHIVGLQITSPIREDNDIDKAIYQLEKNRFDSLFSCQIIKDYFIWKKKKFKLIPNYSYKKRKLRQKISEKYLENGSIYIFNAEKFLKTKNRLFGKIGNYVMKKRTSFQIDDAEDLEIVKKIFN